MTSWKAKLDEALETAHRDDARETGMDVNVFPWNMPMVI